MAEREEDERPGEDGPPEITFSGGAMLRLNLGAAGGQRYAGWYRPPSGADAGLAFPPDEIAWLGIPDGD